MLQSGWSGQPLPGQTGPHGEAGPPADTHFLNPGEWSIGAPGEVFGTLLGSCVAIVLWHPRMRLGAINHFIMPGRPADAARPADGRYCEEAFALIMRALADRGVAPRQCVVKIFGGARLFAATMLDDLDVGARNIEAARAVLGAAGLAASAEDVGGTGWRRLLFDIASGNVWVRFNRIRCDA